jgi:thioredoxin reductase
MITETIDHVVVGFSLAGIKAALRLTDARHSVALLDFDGDTDAIVDLPRVQETSLAPRAGGAEWYRSINTRLADARVKVVTFCHVKSIHHGRNARVDCEDRRWSCKSVVFAPNGTEPGLERSGSLHGFGVSYSAAADGPFFRSKRVAVYGDSPRVIEHAWVAAQYASEVIVLMKGSETSGVADLLNDMRSARGITFESAAVLHSLRAGDDGMLRTIDIETATGRRSIEVSALFVAQHLLPMLRVVRGEVETDGIVFAGLAAGVEYWEHAELVNDGERAARMLLTVNHAV